MGKTGTSAIQKVAFEALFNSNESLEYFPYGLKGDVHNLLSDNYPSFNKDDFVSNCNKISQLDHAKSYLISSEFLCYASDDHIEFLISSIKSAGFSVEILFVVRAYSNLIHSSYLQALKTGYGLKHGESGDAYYDRNISSVRLGRSIKRWGNDPDVEITIFNYDSIKNDLIQCFFDYLGVNIDFNSVNAAKDVNESLLPEFISLIANFDEVNLNDKNYFERRSIFIGNLLAISKEAKPYSKLNVLSKSKSEIACQLYKRDLEEFKVMYKVIE